jgi:CMP-N-acetylneuraminic acid synthetase
MVIDMIVCVIPARIGSKGIPQKNIRSFNGLPLIAWPIKAAKASKCNKVIVTTDSEKIALIARYYGADVVIRPDSLSGDAVPLDPVVIHAVDGLIASKIITVQPTSPMVSAQEINRFIDELDYSDSVISVTSDTHLRWGENGMLYDKRVNRQQLPQEYRETGSVIGCTMTQLSTGERVSYNPALIYFEKSKAIDIDDNADWAAAEAMTGIKTIVFCVIGRRSVGMGHVYRALTIAGDMAKHNIIFICKPEDDLAISHIKSHNYPVLIGDYLKLINETNPDLVINDILDTDERYIKSIPCKTVNFEDLGSGAAHASTVINDLYGWGGYSGYAYYCLRDEFIYTKPEPEEGRILITFGGVDERNLTCEAVRQLKGHKLTVITGPGYEHNAELRELLTDDIEHISATGNIAKYMAKAHCAVTSGGRTVYELLAMRVPTVVCCQNKRELSHKFDQVIHLGMDENNIAWGAGLALKAERPDIDLTGGRQRVKEIIDCLTRS